METPPETGDVTAAAYGDWHMAYNCAGSLSSRECLNIALFLAMLEIMMIRHPLSTKALKCAVGILQINASA